MFAVCINCILKNCKVEIELIELIVCVEECFCCCVDLSLVFSCEVERSAIKESLCLCKCCLPSCKICCIVVFFVCIKLGAVENCFFKLAVIAVAFDKLEAVVCILKILSKLSNFCSVCFCIGSYVKSDKGCLSCFESCLVCCPCIFFVTLNFFVNLVFTVCINCRLKS